MRYTNWRPLPFTFYWVLPNICQYWVVSASANTINGCETLYQSRSEWHCVCRRIKFANGWVTVGLHVTCTPARRRKCSAIVTCKSNVLMAVSVVGDLCSCSVLTVSRVTWHHRESYRRRGAHTIVCQFSYVIMQPSTFNAQVDRTQQRICLCNLTTAAAWSRH